MKKEAQSGSQGKMSDGRKRGVKPAAADVASLRPMADQAPDVATGGKRPAISPGAKTHEDEATATDLARNQYTPHNDARQHRLLLILLGLLTLSMACNIIFGLQETKYRYFATDPQGSVRELTTLSNPIQSNAQVLNWVTGVVTKSWSLSFAQYESQLQEVQLDFTPEGFASFQKALHDTGNLDTIIQNKYVAQAVPTQAPVVVDTGITSDNEFAWKIQIPLLVTYEAFNSKATQNITVEVTVKRRDVREAPSGLGIAQIVTK